MSDVARGAVCRIIAGRMARENHLRAKVSPQVAAGTALVKADLIAAGLSPRHPSSSSSPPAGYSCSRSNIMLSRAGTSRSKPRCPGEVIYASCGACGRGAGGWNCSILLSRA